MSQRKKKQKIICIPSKKQLFKSKVKGIMKILNVSKIKRDRKIEVIEKILYELKEEKD